MQADLFYRNPRTTALAVLFLVVMGVAAYLSLARQEDPTMTERWARVTTFFPGATAERVEALVSEPIETALREVPEVDEITSTSRAGLSVVGIQLYDSIGPDQVDAIWSEIRDELADVAPSLPEDASEPDLDLNKPLASTVIVSIGMQDDAPANLGLLSRIAEALRLRLANMPGTEIAETWGEAEEELLVALDPYALADAGLTPSAVAARIAAADTKTPSGTLRGAAANLLVEVEAELDTPERIAQIPLVSTPSGSLRVSDVATVRKHHLDPPASQALHRGQQVILVNAKMQPGQQIEGWSARALSLIADFESQLPASVELDVVYNQNDYTGERMSSLGLNLVMALIIVITTLIWFMGARSALTVGLALPLSAAMVLLGMQFLNIPMHQMSVTGLIISLGLLIDNAIVVVEDYKLRRRNGSEIADAISKAIRHLVVPLGASTATTVFAFMPIAMSPGGVGDFTGTLGVTVALSVAASFILAMTIVPAIAGMIERRWPTASDSTQRAWWVNGYSNARLTSRYRRVVRAVLEKPWKGFTAALVLPVIGFALAPTLTQQFFPPVDRNQFQIQMVLSAHASIDDTRQAIARADEVLFANPDVVDAYWTIGEGAPRVFYNVVSMNERVVSFASAWVNTRSADATQRILPELQRTLSEALPDAEILALPFEQGPPRDAPIEMRVVGEDLTVLKQQALELRRILATVPEVTYTRASLTNTEPKLAFVPSENAAAAVGLTTGEIAMRLNATLAGLQAGTVQEGATELPVRVRLADAYRDQVADLDSLPVVGSNGSNVPLSELGEWQLVPVAAAINRQDGERISTVQGFLTPFVLPAGALAAFEARLEEEAFALPPGYRLALGGEAEQSAESMGNIMSMFVFFALAMAGVVILSLNSFKQSGIIALVAVLSFGLALFGVRLFGHPFGYMALIGALGMMGLAINGSIIVLSALKANAASVAGDREAMADVVVDATRHIISTTATTIGGFLPLIVSGGTFWPPLATAVAGGVGGSAIIALLLIPAAFSRFHPPNETSSVSDDRIDLEEIGESMPAIRAA